MFEGWKVSAKWHWFDVCLWTLGMLSTWLSGSPVLTGQVMLWNLFWIKKSHLLVLTPFPPSSCLDTCADQSVTMTPVFHSRPKSTLFTKSQENGLVSGRRLWGPPRAEIKLLRLLKRPLTVWFPRKICPCIGSPYKCTPKETRSRISYMGHRQIRMWYTKERRWRHHCSKSSGVGFREVLLLVHASLHIVKSFLTIYP